MRKVLWFFSDRYGCGYYRSYSPAFFLRERGLADVDLVDQREVIRGGRLSEADFEFDVFLMQRAIGGHWPAIQREARRRGIATVIELDDDLFNVPRTNPASGLYRSKAMQRDLRAQLDMADRVIVSTEPLARLIAQSMGWAQWRDRIAICPNHLLPEIWSEDTLSAVTKYQNTNVVIGWQGSTTHQTDFTAAARALATVVETYPQVKLRFFGDVPATVRSLVPESRREAAKGVPFQQYPATLKFLAFDIGIAPLTPNRFNESKSNIKWLEYSALSIPCVASAVYPYAQSIEHGVTGFLATTEAEWVAHLSTLVESEILRRRVGRAAHAAVWSKFSANVHGPAWASVLDSLPLNEGIHASKRLRIPTAEQRPDGAVVGEESRGE